ncbi:diacylglycerol kinase [Halobacillus litoralis]|uniref:Diacylglycerol kinase n=1 Tax=Halobacillus litoralis TaxID=45668 RepID=A0A845E8P5_9BACI|nr:MULTISPECIES: diacylglycerol kinase [Halobacillus]MBN9654861.1 diacylglycerol kinase [Halobacillus sp. GSS1]MEC3885170.1 diacylglycerol kinase [Halobacillus sp. HZG1]MYL50529.1 diacylglycerol kinase [Halobacillus litoralis]MYL71356.1 diacylglycerol kinase [Halobacillus litoralis]
MKSARIIYNPTSGREVIRKVLPDILQRFEQSGYETSTHATTCAGDAVKAAEYAVDREFDLVVAAGGDGTINEVINGLAEKPHKPKVGIIPVGTTNDFARALHVPRNIHKAVDIILEGYSHPLDIGRVNDQYFMNIAGGGKITEISYEVPSKLKTMIGQLAYYLKGIEMLPSIRPTYVEMEYDGKWYEGEIMLFLVSNTNSVGGLEKLAPSARMDDGLFDLMIIEKMNIAEFVRLATLAIQGNHLNHPKFIHTTASRVKVKTDEKMQLNIDGEFGGLLPGEFVNLYRHLDFFVPEDIFKEEEADEEE